MKAIINTVKHIVQESLATIQEQTIKNITIANTVVIEPASPAHVVVGSVIKAVFLEYWLLGESTIPCTATWTVEKNVGGQAAMTHAQGQALNTYPNKRNILKTGQGVIGGNASNPIPVIREWIKIPKGKQRFAQDDVLRFNVSCIGQADNGLDICGIAIYKEQQ